MTNFYAPARFKHPDGSPKQFRELRQKFRDSATAQHLIDYARDTSVRLVEATEKLARMQNGGTYHRETRVTEYSQIEPANHLFHEFRHAVQFDALQVKSSIPLTDWNYMHADFKRAMMAMSITEADAEYHRGLVMAEMQGKRLETPLSFFKRFLSGSINYWYANAAAYRVEANSIHTQYRMSLSHPTLKKLEEKLDERFMKRTLTKGLQINITQGEVNSEIDYLHQLINAVCTDRNGQNYLLGGKTAQEEKEIVGQLRDVIFTGKRYAFMFFVAHKEKRLQEHVAMKQKVMDFLGLGAEYFPLK